MISNWGLDRPVWLFKQAPLNNATSGPFRLAVMLRRTDWKLFLKYTSSDLRMCTRKNGSWVPMSIETGLLLEISWYPVSRNEIQNSFLFSGILTDVDFFPANFKDPDFCSRCLKCFSVFRIFSVKKSVTWRRKHFLVIWHFFTWLR